FEPHRGRFIVGRATLRAILGRYLARRPSELAFRYGEFGKPDLDVPQGADAIRFNMAHSHGRAALAVAVGRELGIDLEQERPIHDADRIVARFFSAAECRVYAGLPDDQKPAAFFRGWTRKEAYLKATGLGLALPLDSFDVSLAPGDPPRLLR